jgi:chromate transporter
VIAADERSVEGLGCQPNGRPDTGGHRKEVFFAFLKLGVTAFGGPIAHLGYFREDLIRRRGWLTEAAYADLIALCQFLPGPASSQVAFALGLIRGEGILGGLTASLAFTLPSALILFILSLGIGMSAGPLGSALLHGLKLVAVAIVAQAVWGMARTLTPDRQRGAIALLAVAVTTLLGNAFGQILAIALGAFFGLILCRGETVAPSVDFEFAVSRRNGLIAFALFGGLLVMLPLAAKLCDWQALKLFGAFYRSGALVFGGGHVVLPLLQTEVVAPGWVTSDTFLTGYGLAQAVPGPLFTFATYLGAVMIPAPHGLIGALIATAGIFLPGLLLVYGMLPFWLEVRGRAGAQAATRGTNAAVVGLLGAALYNPVWVGAVSTPFDFLLALTGFLLGVVWKMPPLAIVVLLPSCVWLRAALAAV